MHRSVSPPLVVRHVVVGVAHGEEHDPVPAPVLALGEVLEERVGLAPRLDWRSGVAASAGIRAIKARAAGTSAAEHGEVDQRARSSRGVVVAALEAQRVHAVVVRGGHTLRRAALSRLLLWFRAPPLGDGRRAYLLRVLTPWLRRVELAVFKPRRSARLEAEENRGAQLQASVRAWTLLAGLNRGDPGFLQSSGDGGSSRRCRRDDVETSFRARRLMRLEYALRFISREVGQQAADNGGSHDSRRVALCLLPILASCWLQRQPETADAAVRPRDKIKENWRSGSRGSDARHRRRQASPSRGSVRRRRRKYRRGRAHL